MTMTPRGQIMLMEQFAPNLPWNVRDPDKLGGVIMQYVRDSDFYYRRWAQKWFECFQYYFGNQSLRWSRRYDFATDYDTARQRSPSMFQRSQTNITRNAFEALCSEMYGNIPDWQAMTASDKPSFSKRAAQIVESILSAEVERAKMDVEFAAAAACFCLYGNFAAKSDWDENCGPEMELPIFEMSEQASMGNGMAPNDLTQGLIQIPMDNLDSSGKPSMEKVWQQKMGPNGVPQTKKVFAGVVRSRVLTPFEYRRPIGSYASHRDKFIQEMRILDYDEWLDEYSKVQGQTRHFYSVKAVYSDPLVYNFAVNHYMRMQTTTPPVFNDALGRQSTAPFKAQFMRGKVFVIEHYDRPHPIKWPKGRRLVITNGVCTHVTVPNYNTNKVDGWNPYTVAQWAYVPPSNMSAGPINDVVLKNKEINVADSLNATAMRRNMGSQLLFKTGGGFDPQKFTGEPGAMMEANDINSVRWLHDDNPLPSILPQMRAAMIQDAYDVAGAGDAIRGQRTPGTASGYQAKQMEEREQKRLSLPKHNFESAIGNWGEKHFTCFRTNCVSLDKAMIGYLERHSAGRFGVPEVYTLLSQPLDFGVDIKVKKESMALKSKATKQATLQELVQGPVGNRVSSDARVMDEYLKEFDAETLRDQSSVHRDRASRENEIFMDMLRLGVDAEGIPRPLVVMQDDDDIHMADHDLFYLQNFDKMRENPVIHRLFLLHDELHRTQKEEKAGRVAPGTTRMIAQAQQKAIDAPQPNYQQIQGQNQNLRMMQQQQAQAQPQNPEAPKTPAPAGSGGQPRLDPNAPSANTPTGANPNTSGASQ